MRAWGSALSRVGVMVSVFALLFSTSVGAADALAPELQKLRQALDKYQDPIAAVQDANNFDKFDEVIISTLPQRASKWLKLDLPSKAGRATGLPVTHVETKAHD